MLHFLVSDASTIKREPRQNISSARSVASVASTNRSTRSGRNRRAVKTSVHAFDINRIQFNATANITKKLDLIKKPDPYYVLFKNDIKIYKSEFINSTMDPVWLPAILDAKFLKSTNDLRLAVMDKDTFSNDDVIGEAILELPLKADSPVTIINPKSKKPMGTFFITELTQPTEMPSTWLDKAESAQTYSVLA